MHENSLSAYHAVIESGNVEFIKHKIFQLLLKTGPLTDKQICANLDLQMASVQPRISDAVAAGALMELPNTAKDHVTGIRVRTVRVRKSTEIVNKTQTRTKQKIEKVMTVVHDDIGYTDYEVIASLQRLGYLK
ncbi:hypothetical protein KAU11_08245 [Candidatus Babeliales bacterium]|nr:hypothetical protein [Candidatus Babeliales bacterium]